MKYNSATSPTASQPPKRRAGHRRTVELLVEEVAPPPDPLPEEHGGRCHVRPAPERLPPAAEVQDHRDEAADQPPVEGETRVRRQGDSQQVALVDVPAVDDVVDAGPDG